MMKLLSFLPILILMSGTTPTLFAQTEIEGRVNGRWTIEDSPYQAIATIYIPAHRELDIDPGVVVLFEEESAFYIFGTLNSVGTADDSIIFRPVDEEGSWLGMRFIDADGRAQIEYSILTNGRRLFGEEHSDTLNHGGNIFSWRSDISVKNTRISNGIARGFGGGFSIHGGQVEFENCFFDNNITQTLGGAGNLDMESEANIVNCVFFQNRGDWGGGGFNIFAGSNVTLSGSRFNENEGSAGGAISLYGGTLLAENCTFTENTGFMGGALYLRHESNSAELFHCDFIRNRADGAESRGGAIMLRDGFEAEVANCRFIENYSQWSGGAIYFAGRANSNLHNNLYLRNFAERVGGAIGLNQDMGERPVIIPHSTFLDNRSGGGEHSSHIVYLPNRSSMYITSSILWGPTPHFQNDDNIEVRYSQTNEGFRGQGNSDENPELFTLDSTWALIGANSPCFDSGDPDLPDDPDGSHNDRGWQYLPHDAAAGLEVDELSVELSEGERVSETLRYINTTDAPIYVTPLDLWREGPEEVLVNISEIVGDRDVQAALKIDGGYLIAGGNNGDDPNKIYRLDDEFDIQQTFNQPGGVDGEGFLDMAAFDDEIIFAGDREQIVEFTINGELGEQYEGPDAVNRFTAVGVDIQYAENGLNFYFGGDEGYIVKTDDDFWEIDRTEVGDSIRALGMKSNCLAAYIVTEHSRGQHILTLVTPDNGRVAQLYELTSARPEAVIGGFEITTDFEDGRGTMVGIWKNAEGDDDLLFVTNLYTTWLCVYPQWELLMPGDSISWEILFAGDQVDQGEYTTEFYLSVNGYGEGNEIPASLDVLLTSVEDEDGVISPDNFRLLSIAPNPFNSRATINFYMPDAGSVSVRVFDHLGRDLGIINQGVFSAGKHQANINASTLNSGTYYIQLSSNGNTTAVESLVLIK